jgi:hypothetical protein
LKARTAQSPYTRGGKFKRRHPDLLVDKLLRKA